LLAIGCALIGCQSLPERPARLVDPGPEVQASLASVLLEATGREVVIGVDAFTQSSSLYVTHRERGSVNRAPRLGRVMVEPLRFDLVIRGERCYVVDARTQASYSLSVARCAAAPE
jgi:hypothetical protein